MAIVRGRARIFLTRSSGIIFDLAEALDAGTCYVESKDLDFGDPRVKKMLRRIGLQFGPLDQLTNVVITLKWRNRLDEALVSDTERSVSTNDKSIRVRTPAKRYFRIRITDNGIKERWKLTAMDFFGRATSRRHQ